MPKKNAIEPLEVNCKIDLMPKSFRLLGSYDYSAKLPSPVINKIWNKKDFKMHQFSKRLPYYVKSVQSFLAGSNGTLAGYDTDMTSLKMNVDSKTNRMYEEINYILRRKRADDSKTPATQIALNLVYNNLKFMGFKINAENVFYYGDVLMGNMDFFDFIDSCEKEVGAQYEIVKK